MKIEGFGFLGDTQCSAAICEQLESGAQSYLLKLARVSHVAH